MRNRFLMKSAVAALCAVVLGLVGCDNGSDAQPVIGKGTVRVVMEDGQAEQTDARTAVPASPGFAYTLTFTAGGKTPVNVTLDGNAGEVELEAGTWTLTAIGSKDGTNIAEGGPVTVSVPSGGEAVSVSVLVRPVLNGADGTFRYNIGAAENLTIVSARLTALNIGEFGELTTNLSVAGGLQTESLMPGYYWLEVTVRRGSQTLVRREAVHIYSGATTVKSYNLTEEDFYGIRLEAVAAYLTSAVYEPVPLAVSADLGNGGWETLLSAINRSGKYVALDISACAMDGTEFDPGTDNAGVDKVFELVLPDAARSIKAGTSTSNPTFKAFTSLGSISGAGVETVGNFTFYACNSLKSVSLPLVRTIPAGSYSSYYDTYYGVFEDCDALETVSLPSATSIGDYAFYYCDSLESVDMPSVTSIGDYAFSGTALTSVSLPASLTTIGNNAFSWCTNLSALTVDSANTTFSARDGMLLDKAGTTLIAYPSATGSVTLTVTSIGDYAFYGCATLESVDLPAATDIGDSAFQYCRALESVSLPLVQTIPAGSYSNYTYYGVFSGCTALKAIDLPAVETIGNYTFYNCVSLESVSLPLVQTIPAGSYSNYTYDGVFSGCTALKAIDLPAVTSIGSEAFRNCTALESVSLPLLQTIPAGSYNSSSGTYSGVFSGCRALKAIDLPAVTSIGNYAFAGAALESVSLPAATSIGSSTFRDCAALTSVSLPAVTSIGNYAFSGAALTSVSLPAATDIGYEAFSGCAALTSVSLPAATDVGSYAFENCGALESVSLPAATSIGGYAFENCRALTSVSLPSATSIGQQAFENCASLASIDLPLVQTIPAGLSLYNSSSMLWSYYGLFSGCTALKTIDLPAVTSIGSNAFANCRALESVSLPLVQTIPNGYSGYSDGIYITYGVFIDCRALKTIDLPSATSIGREAFWGCEALTSVSLPVATYIGEYAFYSCAALTSVSLPATPPSIGRYIFSSTGSTDTITITVPAGAVPAYTSAWRVSASTSARGNTDVYGSSHKAVLITDAVADIPDVPPGNDAKTSTYTVNLDKPLDGVAENFTLSKSGTPASITLATLDTYTVYAWYLNDGDDPVSADAAYTLYAADCPNGKNFITIWAQTSGGVHYSKEITFTVNQ
jgi:hypothetical protein